MLHTPFRNWLCKMPIIVPARSDNVLMSGALLALTSPDPGPSTRTPVSPTVSVRTEAAEAPTAAAPKLRTLHLERKPPAVTSLYAREVDVVMAHPQAKRHIKASGDHIVLLADEQHPQLEHPIYVRRSRFSPNGRWLALRWYYRNTLNNTDPPGGIAFVSMADVNVRTVVEDLADPIWIDEETLVARRDNIPLRVHLSEEGEAQETPGPHAIEDFGCTSLNTKARYRSKRGIS